MQEEDKVKIGDRVKTPDGEGILKDIQEYKGFKRYGVRLDNNPFNFSPVYYNKPEVELIK